MYVGLLRACTGESNYIGEGGCNYDGEITGHASLDSRLNSTRSSGISPPKMWDDEGLEPCLYIAINPTNLVHVIIISHSAAYKIATYIIKQHLQQGINS